MPQYEYVYKYSLPLYESHSSTRTTCSCSLGSKVLSFLRVYHNTDTPRPFPLVYHPCSPHSKNGDFPICAVPGNSRCSMGQRLLVLLAGLIHVPVHNVHAYTCTCTCTCICMYMYIVHVHVHVCVFVHFQLQTLHP